MIISGEVNQVGITALNQSVEEKRCHQGQRKSVTQRVRAKQTYTSLGQISELELISGQVVVTRVFGSYTRVSGNCVRFWDICLLTTGKKCLQLRLKEA